MITTLENTALSVLTTTFNQAFAGYYVPINFTEAGMRERILRARIDLAQSVGVIEDDRLVAFMLTGTGEQAGRPTAYNAGTGVLPAYRGRRLVKAMYDWAIPRWQRAGIQRASLEVITQNERAIRAYQGVGFSLGRRLRALKKDIVQPIISDNDPPRKVDQPSWEQYADLKAFNFAWDYQRTGVEALGAEYTHYAWGEGALRAYAIVHRLGRIAQAGRREDGPSWRQLLGALEHHHPQLSWVNLDESATELIAATRQMGWTPIIDQFEMTRSL